MWGYQGEPDPSLRGVAVDWMAGRVLGGSSSVNGMVWVRGHPADFDRWAAAGLPRLGLERRRGLLPPG